MLLPIYLYLQAGIPARQGDLLYPPDASGGYFDLVFATPPHLETFSALTLSEENYTS